VSSVKHNLVDLGVNRRIARRRLKIITSSLLTVLFYS